jgi:tetratricopeptide (TPR) repeat protein
MLWYTLTLSAQVVYTDNALLLSRGDKQFTKGNYAAAEEFYSQLAAIEPENTDVLKRLGVVKVYNRKFEEAIAILDTLVQQEDTTDLYVGCQLANALYQTGQYARSRRLYRAAAIDSATEQLALQGLEQLDYVQKMTRAPDRNVSVRRIDSAFSKNIDEDVSHQVIDPSSISVTILPGGDKAYYIREEKPDGATIRNIYTATCDSSGRWGGIARLPEPLNSAFSEDYLFWSEEEGALYFSSNRIPTMGGYDIFRAEEGPDGALLPPVNLGVPVNTPGDDILFIRSGSTAWYSSNFGQPDHAFYQADFLPEPCEPEIVQATPAIPWYKKYGVPEEVERIERYGACRNFYYDSEGAEADTASDAYRELLGELLGDAGLRVRLTGYADWTGDEVYNSRLSFERVSALFYALRMDGVGAEQLLVDFRGGGSPRTATHFDDREMLRRAKALNRCVTVEVVDHGAGYLYVQQEPGGEDLLAAGSDRYAVMVHVSEEEMDGGGGVLPEDIGFFERDGLFFYHTEPSGNLVAVAAQLNDMKEWYVRSYLFRFR